MITCAEIPEALENTIALGSVSVSLKGLQGANGACCADWASAGPHTPPFSSPQSWDLRAPGQRREDGTLPRFLEQSKEKKIKCTVSSQAGQMNNQTTTASILAVGFKREDR